MKTYKEKLKSIRQSIENENISYDEIIELQSLSDYINKNDKLLLERANVPEND